MTGNLKKRHQGYYVRVGVNPKHQKLIGRTETVRSLKTRDKATAERIKYGVIQELKDFHDRLVREAQAGLEGQTSDAMQLRDSDLDTDTAAEILSNRLEERLAALGRTPSEIEAMSADDIDPLVRESFRIVRDDNYMPLDTAIKQYLDIIEKDVTNRTWQQKKKQLDLFAEWAGRVNIESVDRRLTSRYINECMVRKGLAPNTNINNVAILTAFFNWLIDNGLYDHANPFARKGKSLKGSKKGSSFVANRAWTKEELTKLFKALDKQREGSVKHKSGIAARISLWSGMRQEEVCGMPTNAVNLTDNFFAVADDPKNHNSVRQVPIHDEIRPLIESLVDASTDGYLIDGLPTGTLDKKRGHSLGNRFSDVKRELFPDSKPRELTFHGLRSTFITAMEKAGIPESTAKLIDGHTRQSLSYGLYSKGLDLDGLAEAMSKVKLL
ncbi:MAG: tyrosine-type recombinase/integrase [Proteobacteria bacterium]|nr:tyrosine-type recombinase/integrase [Pseudomonadota bacterium]